MTWTTGKPRTGTTWWKALRTQRLKLDGHRCTWLDDGHRCTATATDVDDIVPEFEGGNPRDIDNLRSLCAPHHRRKTAAEGVRARQQAPRKRPAEAHPGLRRAEGVGGDPRPPLLPARSA